ncbi:hypothetical protein RhiirA5_438734 [Rhizophagus irregularis]|uniref:Uncharacterized protein n=1 Tax=Rhizophagus irregularis TaxID=588596 RepID=A0A2N0NIQ6_9GLOM|nr:hypothetical protein RhiirA5_438734 [Rhizophagus irregularis]
MHSDFQILCHDNHNKNHVLTSVLTSVFCGLNSLIGIDLSSLWNMDVLTSVLCGLDSLIGINLSSLWIGLFDQYQLQFLIDWTL